jgi:hypothetical protein
VSYKALAPWVVPLALMIGIAAVAISYWFLAIPVVLIAGAGVPLRLRYLKEHPPEAELRRRNFWDLR